MIDHWRGFSQSMVSYVFYKILTIDVLEPNERRKIVMKKYSFPNECMNWDPDVIMESYVASFSSRFITFASSLNKKDGFIILFFCAHLSFRPVLCVQFLTKGL